MYSVKTNAIIARRCSAGSHMILDSTNLIRYAVSQVPIVATSGCKGYASINNHLLSYLQ